MRRYDLGAVHEAGHVIAALALNVRVESAEVNGGGGATIIPGLDRLAPDVRCKIVLAGLVAEDRARFGVHNVLVVSTLRAQYGDTFDGMHVFEALRDMGGDPDRNGWRLLDETVALLDRHQRAVDQVANALGRRSKMTGGELCELLNIEEPPATRAPADPGRRHAPSIPTGKPATAEDLRELATRAHKRGQSQLAALLQATITRQPGAIQRAMLR